MRKFSIRHTFSLYAVLCALSLSLTSCSEQSIEQSIKLENDQVEHTILMYLLADNNLYTSMLTNIRDAEKGMAGVLPSTRLLVYLDAADTTALCEVRYLPYGNDNHLANSKILKVYPKQTSTDVEVMQQVMADVKEFAPSLSYGLVISGHGTGWFPNPTTGTIYEEQRVAASGDHVSSQVAEEHQFAPLMENPQTRHIGYDNNQKESCMTSDELVEGLGDMHFDYIIFDACFMSSIEFVYDLRGITDYILASPVEIMARGFPYENIIRLLLTPNTSLVDVAADIVDTYINTSFSSVKSVSVAVVDCSKLDVLADAVAAMYQDFRAEEEGPCDVVERLDMTQIQTLERMQVHAFFDLDDYLCQLAGGDVAKYQDALNQAVIYAANTPDIFSYGFDEWGLKGYGYISEKVGGELDLCGVSCYLPRYSTPVTSELYLQTAWARKVYGDEVE